MFFRSYKYALLYSTTIQFVSASLITDFIKLRKLILPRTGLEVKLSLTPPEFHIWTSETNERFRLKIVDASLHVVLFEPTAKFVQEIQTRLSANACLYDFEQWTPLKHQIGKDLIFFETPDFSYLTRASKIYCFFTLESMSQNRNPFDFRWDKCYLHQTGKILAVLYCLSIFKEDVA